jgi:dsDNA-binding SOS-regulon protein
MSDEMRNYSGSITGALHVFAVDEGSEAAIRKAEAWRDALEEMLEVSNAEEQGAVTLLLSQVREAITDILEHAKPDAFGQGGEEAVNGAPKD